MDTGWTRNESDPRYTEAELLGCEMGTAQNDPPGQVGWEVLGGPWGRADGAEPTEGEAQAAAAGWVRAYAARDLERLGLLPRWIPVTERLPAEDQEVLAIDRDRCQDVVAYQGGYWIGYASTFLDNVTHWMPLPLLPQV